MEALEVCKIWCACQYRQVWLSWLEIQCFLELGRPVTDLIIFSVHMFSLGFTQICLNDQAKIAWFTSTWGVYPKLVWISQHPYSSFLRSEETPLESWQPEHVLLHVFGHIMLKTPVLVRSLKLSSIEPCEYLDGWPPGNTRCWRQFCCVGFWTAMWV